MNRIIRKPLITEKATFAMETRNRFSFEVEKSANKIEIKKAVEKMYGVHVTEVRTQTYGGGKSSVKQTNKGIVVQPNNPWKKAIVTVADGETIDLYNNI
jgi:large subunit ribosomal protein L23